VYVCSCAVLCVYIVQSLSLRFLLFFSFFNRSADYNYAPDFQPDIPPALTCFVALQNISECMGPTTFILNSSTEEYHNEINAGQYNMYSSSESTTATTDETTDETTGGKSILLEKSKNKLSTLNIGDCSLYNPMTLHCGGANRSNSRRIIFYFSFKNPKFNEKDWPLAYASLRPDLRTRNLSLSQIKSILVSREM
jgi:ectoine hydroxylase-related dioxygenase (phytanoyl-CoA dioxygenase family)